MSLRQGGLVANCDSLSDLISLLSRQSACLQDYLHSYCHHNGSGGGVEGNNSLTQNDFPSLSIVKVKMLNQSNNLSTNLIENQCSTFCVGVPECGDDTWRDPETAAGSS